MKTKAKQKSPTKAAGKPAAPSAKASTARTGTAPAAKGTPRPTPGSARPLADRVLLRRLDEAEVTVGGIVIPDTAKEKPLQAEVVAVGPGRLTKAGKRIAPDLKKGDRVLIGKYSGTEVRIDHEDYVIVREDEVFATLGR